MYLHLKLTLVNTNISQRNIMYVKIRCDVVTVFWQGQIAAEFDERMLEDMLNAIPEDLSSQDLCPWFRTVFVPFVRKVIPTGQVKSDKYFYLHHMVLCFQLWKFLPFALIENPGKMAGAEGKESGVNRKGKEKKQKCLSKTRNINVKMKTGRWNM